MFLRRLAAVLGASMVLAGLQVAGSAPASAAAEVAYFDSAAATVLYYDASRAQEFVAVVNQGAEIWNSKATTVKLMPVTTGQTPDIRVYADDGWPRTYSTSLGNGYWYMGREAVVDGYYEPRIAAHEFGHILGLPDNRTGLCADLMSGSSAPVSCTNANPNSTEVAKVDANFRTSVTIPARTYVWQGVAAL